MYTSRRYPMRTTSMMGSILVLHSGFEHTCHAPAATWEFLLECRLAAVCQPKLYCPTGSACPARLCKQTTSGLLCVRNMAPSSKGIVVAIRESASQNCLCRLSSLSVHGTFGGG